MTSTVRVAPLRKPNINRKALMLSCAVSAVAAGTVAPQRARADAFNGTMVNSPAATRINTGTGTETVSINPNASGRVTINWTPNEAGSGTINFLSNGNTATFQSVPGVTDYTVLNRVLPTDATRGISLNGTILSKLNDGSTGGRIWFYSPGGILVGSTARIDVGSLLLTTLDPVGFGSSADGFGQFQNQFDQTSTVSIDSLAQINANNAGSYVALIAPRVEQHGSVSVNGSAAYVAAEDVTMTINNGLFDIQVDLGTRDTTGVVHDGTTTGAANVDAGDNHSIYMVAVPKDTALTMLLSGNVGFAAATSATVENGQIVLSAGHNVFQGDFGVQFDQANAVGAGMNLGTGSYTSDVIGQATSDVNVNATTGNTSFSSNLDLTSVDGAVRLTATNGNQLTVSGAGSLTSTKQFNPDLPLDPAIAVSAGSGGKINVIKNLDLTASDDGFGGGFSHGGNIYVTANGGDVTVNGRITADASARDSYPSDESVSDAEGGFIYLRAMNGGKLTAGSVDADASAEGGYTNVQGVSAGDGTAGRVYLHAQSDGLLTVAGNVFATANGIGGDVIGNGDATGNGVGGLAFVRAETGGDVAIGGSLTMHGDGTGGSVRNPVTAFGINGGIGRGSDYLQGDPTKDDGVGIGTFADTSSVTVGGNVTLSANGTGGNGYNGGAAFGGDAGVRTSGGTIAITGNLDFRTTAAGGNAVQAFGGNGGYAEGGNAYVQADLLSGTIASISGANVFLDVGATGGTGGAGNGDNSPGVGGDGRAGTYDGQKDGSGGAFVLADSQGASLALGNITLKAIGTGGAGGAGGAGQNGAIGGQGFGGTANAGTFRTPNFLNDPTAAAVVTFGDVLIDASGQGGAGGAGGASAQQGVGGNGTGGLPCPPTGTRCGGVILSGRGTVSFGNADLIAKGFGGAGSTAGTGVGGDVEVIVRGTGTLTGTGDLKLSAAGFGGNGGTGGSGMGGFAGIEVANTGVLTAGWIYADSGGVGGTGTNAGGSGWGRESYVGTLNSGKINATKLQLWSPGFGGSALGDAGSGNGGWSHIVMQGGEINAGILQVQAFGLGGNSTVGMGGNALGGEATIDVSLAGKITFGSELTIDASATGGNGGINGGGQAGSDDVEAQANAALNVNGGTVTGPGVLTVSTNATAGANSEPDGVGANAYGGESNVSITSGTLQAGSMQVLAGATGGSADSLGGSGYGGVAYMEALSSGAISAATKLFIDASGTGGGATGQGGYGEGGEGTLYLNGGSVTVTSTSLDDTNPTFQISTFGNGGSGAIGGDAQGGDTSFLYGSGGSMSVAGFGVLWANANGGVGTNDDFGNGGAGGNATGGTVTFNSPGNVTVASLRLAANGFGGDGGAGDIDGNGGDGGNATGGTVTADIYGNTTTGNLVLRAFGEAGFGGAGINGGRGGDGTGGSSTLTVHSGTLSTAAIEHSTYGFAGDGGAGTTGVGGNGGDALGGTLNFLVGGGSMSAGAIANNANGFGGNGGAAASGVGGAGGNAQGGTSTITIDGALTALGLGSLNQGTAGVGGAGTTQGDGGSGTGGSVTATINGSVNITGLAANNQGNFTMTAFGQGGNGGNGGDGQGGSSTVNNNGILSISNRLQVTAQSLGGDGSSGTGGQGNGGSASLVNTGTLTAVELFQGAGGTGGAGVTAGGDAMAGTATITQVGDMSLAFGNLVANAVGGAASAGDGGDALSGEASLTVTEGGALTSGNLTVSADATGGAGTTSGGDAANEVYARIVVDAGGSAVLSGTTLVSATATGGAATTGSGGVADGGNAEFTSDGSVTGSANLRILSQATGGNGSTGGAASGGSSGLYVANGGLVSLNSANLISTGMGGRSSGDNGAAGTGGTSEIIATGANSRITLANVAPFVANVPSFDSRYLASALGFGGQSDGGAGIGGTGTGGRSTVRAEAGGIITLPSGAANRSDVVARGFGGDSSVEGGIGGSGVGSLAEAGADGGTLIAPNLLVSSYGEGGSSAAPGLNIAGGDGTGGSRNLFALNGGLLRISATGGGPGGIGGNGSGTGNGGNGIGGAARLDVDGSVVELTGDLSVFSQVGGGIGATGGDAGGGSAVISVVNGGQILDIVGTATLGVFSGAVGGNGTVEGGQGNASTATLTVDSSSSINVATLSASSDGTGGAGPIGGAGEGGVAQFSIGGSLTAGTVHISATGTGADGASGGQEGAGGDAIFTILAGGTATLGSIDIAADGFGGGSSAGFGGNGYGGTARIVASGDLTVTGETFVSAEGEGGDGDLGGGQGWGGIAELLTHNGAIVQLGTATNVEAEGTGASATGSGNGGDGYGGYAHVRADGGSQLTANDLTVKVSAEGGGGVAGGDAYGGYPIEGAAGAVVEAADAGSILRLTGSTTIEARAEGGSGTSGLASGFGGFALLSAADSQIDFSTLLMDTTAVGNDGSTAVHRGTARVATQNGSITGGAVTLLANAGTVTGQVQIDANGNGPTGQSMDFAALSASASGPLGAGDILIDVAAATIADFGVVTLTANGGGVPGAGEDGIEIGSQGTLTASQLTMNSSDGIRISTANGGTINVSGTIDANSQALIRLLDDGAGGAISSNTLDLAGADIQITALVQAADILMTLPGNYAINGLPVATDSLTIKAGGNITAAANLIYANSLELIAGADISILDLAAGGDLTLAAPGAITAGTIDAGGKFLALAHGNMVFGEVTASEVFLADFSMLTPSGSVGGLCVGTCGTLGADGDVTAPPSGSTYQYVTTDGGVTGEGQIAGVGGTDGSLYTTSAFTAAAGDDLSFWFNYVTSDGSDFTDYAWAQLLDGNLNPIAMLYTARTQPSGTIVPGQGLPGVEATLNPASVPINPDATTWSALGFDSGSCYDLGCGNTGWISSTYQIANAGTYVLRFGVTNFSDTAYESGMAFSGISIGGQTVTPGLTPTGGSITIGNVTTGNMQAAAGTTLTTGTIDATDFVDLHSGGNMQTGNITAGQYLQADAGGTMNLGVLSIGQDVTLDATGNISFVSANVGTDFDFDTGGSLNGGNVTAGNHIGGTAGGTITLADLTVTGGLLPDESFSVGMSAGGDIVIGNVSATNPVGFATPGNLTSGNVSAGGLFMTLVGGDIGLGSITTDAAGRVYLADYSMFAPAGGSDNFDAALVLALAPVATSGSIAINGPVSTGMFEAAAGTTFTAGDISATTSIAAGAGGNLQVGNAQAGASIDLSSGGSIVSTSLDAPSVSLTLAGDFTTGDLSVDNSLSITAGGNLTAGNILAGGDLALTAGLVLTALDLSANGDIVLRAGGNIDAGDLSAGGSLNFNSTAGAISVGSLDAVAGGIFASAATGVDIADATVGLGVEIHTGGDLSIGDIDANTGVELDAEGDVLASDIDSASHVIVTSGGDFEVSDVTAGTTADFTAGGLASFLGIVSSPEITVTSADIDIVDGASLGVRGVTDRITFNAVSAGQEVILGGDGTEAAAGQYQLAEDGDIESDTVVFNAVGASQGQPVNVRILDAEIEGSATQGGGVSSVTLNTAGSVFVKGVLSFTGAAASDTLAIHAGDSIQVVTDTGGIEMLGSDGNVAGTLDLTAHDIWVADQALLDQLNGASNLSDFEGALATNNGDVVPDGYLRAGGIDVTMLGSSLLVQNTGTDADPAGLTIGDGGLNIVNQGSDPATVIIFGHRQNGDGTTTGGDAFLDEVQFSGPGGFDNSSTVNGCDVDGCGPSGETPGSIGGVESILGPIGLMSDPADLASAGGDDFALPFDEGTDEASEEDDDEDSSDEDSSVDASVGLINTGPVSVEPPVEEPVTSGNDGPGF